jgi:1-acyl-sn-glycerol-3-phosphate acyltransferase
MAGILGGGDETARRAKRPQELAASRATPPQEGLAWLGRRPDGRLGILARALLALASSVLFGLARLRLRVEGREHLPPGGYLLAVAVHRGWVDPLVVVRALPAEPRPWFLTSGASAFDRAWKESLLRRAGGVLPVWRGGADLATHLRSARAVVAAGCPFVLFIEGAVAGPPDRVNRTRSGVGLFALRLEGTPIVPLAIAGTDDLYRGKRIAVRILPPTSVADLLGEARPPVAPGPDTRDELRLARLVTERLAERLSAAVSELYPGTVDAAGARHGWRWLRRLF